MSEMLTPGSEEDICHAALKAVGEKHIQHRTVPEASSSTVNRSTQQNLFVGAAGILNRQNELPMILRWEATNCEMDSPDSNLLLPLSNKGEDMARAGIYTQRRELAEDVPLSLGIVRDTGP